MSAITPAAPVPVVYPDSDGQPMAQNTRQLRWIVVLFDNLSALFADRPDVFVGSDLFWYPVEGQPEVRIAPDVLVAFGRPKGDRGSYQQWQEGNVPLTVAVEILSPGNAAEEMSDKFDFYTEHGVEEYLIYNPDTNRLRAYRRQGTALLRVPMRQSYVSPRLGARFVMTSPEMKVYYPDGRPFLSFEELGAARAFAERERDEANRQRDEATRQRDEANRLVVRMGELVAKALAQSATPEEVAELARLGRQAAPPSSAS